MCEKSISKHGKTIIELVWDRFGMPVTSMSICIFQYFYFHDIFSREKKEYLECRQFQWVWQLCKTVISPLSWVAACLGESRILTKAHAYQLLMLVIELVCMEVRKGSENGAGQQQHTFPSFIFSTKHGKTFQYWLSEVFAEFRVRQVVNAHDDDKKFHCKLLKKKQEQVRSSSHDENWELFYDFFLPTREWK